MHGFGELGESSVYLACLREAVSESTSNFNLRTVYNFFKLDSKPKISTANTLLHGHNIICHQTLDAYIRINNYTKTTGVNLGIWSPLATQIVH